MNQKHKVAIGLGANLGDRQKTLKTAAARLADDLLMGAISSSVYESPPWGFKAQPDFLNAVIIGATEWKPPAIMNFLKQLEKELGRQEGAMYGPRHIDLDLLAFDGEIWESDDTLVPHPRMTERDFVLVPLREVWAEWQHPRLQKKVTELVESLSKRTPLSAKLVGPPLLDKELQ